MPASMVPQKATPQPPQEALQQAPQEAQAATSLLETAVFLHKQGLALVPIRPGTKEPHADVLRAVHGTSELRPFTLRRASLPEVAAWFAEDEDCQLAVLAGAASGGVGFVDVDDPDAAADLVRALYALGGPVTITPRPGLRFWFRQKEPI
ncbi:MAG TPA: bifunctional DNA primase/polymerase, partial [Bacillota bacterium]